MKLIMTFLMSCMILSSISAASLVGSVVDATTGETLIGANISIYKNGELLRGTVSDLDGEYLVEMLDAVTYSMKISYVGYKTLTVEEILLVANEESELMIELHQGVSLSEVIILAYKVPQLSCRLIGCGGLVANHCPNMKCEKEEADLKEEKEEYVSIIELSVFPNPVTEMLSVNLLQSAESLIIQSMDGKEMLHRSNLSEGIVALNVSDYAAGTYVLQVLHEGKVRSEKFVVARL